MKIQALGLPSPSMTIGEPGASSQVGEPWTEKETLDGLKQSVSSYSSSPSPGVGGIGGHFKVYGDNKGVVEGWGKE